MSRSVALTLRLLTALCLSAGGSTPSRAATPAGDDLFERSVRPLLAEHCFPCHSHAADKIKGGLVLDSRAGLLSGGDSGPAIVPDKPGESRLIKAVSYGDPDLQMPPKNNRLSADQVAALTEWVNQGAPWPDEAGSTAKLTLRPRGKITDEDRQWWAFQPVRKPSLPPDSTNGWAQNPIDRFIHDRLRREGLTPAPAADPRAFIRRVTFDLIGLPPTPEEVAAFERACQVGNRESAIENLADRLLASPRYGERWARHWLDLVRYAESDGYRVDDYRPHVWRYRDWVVRAFNDDLPYDRFVQAQLAGDELWPGDPQLARVATAFLRHWIYEYNNRDARGQQQTILNDLTDVTGDVLLGMGVQCARCHDHKFDPILQQDYFRLQAFFAPLLPRQDLVVATEREQREHDRRLALWREAARDTLAQIEALEAPNRERAAQAAFEKFPEDIQQLLRKPAAERSPLDTQIYELAYRQISYEWARLQTHFKGDEKQRLEALNRELRAFDSLKPEPLPPAFTVTDVGPVAPPVFLPKSRNGAPVEPGFLSVLDPAPAQIHRTSLMPNSTGRRATLAKWLTSPENPLTARVLVNRVWQHHFGRGLVNTSSDFGTLGERPTHPELLDWLAARFVQEGWSLKQLHRLIVTSATYQQGTLTEGNKGNEEPNRFAVNSSSFPSLPSVPSSLVRDPDNRLISRFPTRRLDAEQIRDALFTATGELDLTAGGPSTDFGKPRRTVYARVTRNTRDPLMDVFDAPENFASTSQRNVTTTPTQSLLLINSQFMQQRARAFARRLVREAGDDDSRRTDLAYRLAFGRRPLESELQRALAFLGEQGRNLPPEKPKVAPFLAEKMPSREGRAAVLQPKSAQERFVVPAHSSLPTGDFTAEAYVLLRSAPAENAHRIIVSRWDGSPTKPGWALSVVGKGSMQKPQTLVLQLSAGGGDENSHPVEVISSGLTLDLNKPYYVAAAVKFGVTSDEAVTFVVKDAANDCEPPQVVRARLTTPAAGDGNAPLTLGGVAPGAASLWDGLLDDVRLSTVALPIEQLLVTTDAVPPACVGWWRFEPSPGTFRDLSPAGNDITPPAPPPNDTLDARTQSLADFCHVLLNSNEFLYTD
jgi:hypothetical protein